MFINYEDRKKTTIIAGIKELDFISQKPSYGAELPANKISLIHFAVIFTVIITRQSYLYVCVLITELQPVDD